MKVLLELLPLLIIAGVVWLFIERSRMTRQERLELTNLRVFKDKVRDAALTEVEIDASAPLARIILDHVHQVDAANTPGKELS